MGRQTFWGFLDGSSVAGFLQSDFNHQHFDQDVQPQAWQPVRLEQLLEQGDPVQEQCPAGCSLLWPFHPTGTASHNLPHLVREINSKCLKSTGAWINFTLSLKVLQVDGRPKTVPRSDVALSWVEWHCGKHSAPGELYVHHHPWATWVQSHPVDLVKQHTGMVILQQRD